MNLGTLKWVFLVFLCALVTTEQALAVRQCEDSFFDLRALVASEISNAREMSPKQIRDHGSPQQYFAKIRSRYTERQLSKLNWIAIRYHRRIRRSFDHMLRKSRVPGSIPAHFFKEPFDLLGVHDNFINGTPGSKEYEEAKTLVFGWLDTYGSFESRLFAKISEGFTAILQLKELEEYEKLYDLTRKGFDEELEPQGGIELRLTQWTKGRKESIDVPFERYSNYLRYKSERKRAVLHVFTHKFWEEYRKDSETFRTMIEQGILFELLNSLKFDLELKLEKLEAAGEYRGDLVEVRDKIKMLLSDPYIRTRDDAHREAIRILRETEKKFRSSTNSTVRNGRAGAKLPLNEETLENLKKRASFLAPFRAPILYAPLLVIMTSLYSVISYYAFDSGPIGRIIGYFQAEVHDTVKEGFGMTAEERTCFFNDREWSFDVCVPAEFLKGWSAEIAADRSKDLGDESAFDEQAFIKGAREYSIDAVINAYHSVNAQRYKQARDIFREEGYFGAATVLLSQQMGAYAFAENQLAKEDNELSRAELKKQYWDMFPIDDARKHYGKLGEWMKDYLTLEDASKKAELLAAMSDLAGIDMGKVLSFIETKREEITKRMRYHMELPEGLEQSVETLFISLREERSTPP